MAAPFPTPFKTWHSESYDAIDPSRPELSLRGKTAVITGGGGTVGLATAKALARAGVKYIALTGRTVATLENAKRAILSAFPDTQVSIHSADATSSDSMKTTLQSIRKTAGSPINILIANAGFLAALSTVAESDPKEVETAISINILGSFNTVQAFLAVADPAATIIHVSSGVAHLAPVPPLAGVSAYAAGKAGAAKLFEYAQMENPKMTVVNVQPGVILSDINRKHGMPAQDHEDLPGHFIVWLCSPEASFLKGRYVWANWDVDELKGRAAEIEKSRLFSMSIDGFPTDY